MRIVPLLLISFSLISCENVEGPLDSLAKEQYDVGYNWAKQHQFTQEKRCQKFIQMFGSNPELRGCRDFVKAYKYKRREMREESYQDRMDDEMMLDSIEPDSDISGCDSEGDLGVDINCGGYY